MVPSNMFDGFFTGILTSVIVIAIVFGGGFYFLGRLHGYNKAVKEITSGKVKFEKQYKIDSTLILKRDKK